MNSLETDHLIFVSPSSLSRDFAGELNAYAALYVVNLISFQANSNFVSPEHRSERCSESPSERPSERRKGIQRRSHTHITTRILIFYDEGKDSLTYDVFCLDFYAVFSCFLPSQDNASMKSCALFRSRLPS